MLKFIILSIFLSLTLVAQEIKLGSSTDLSGPNASLGQAMNRGIQTYLKKNNLNPKKKYSFSLQTYDDQYRPIEASKNIEKLIYKDKVLAFLGNFGTPTAKLTIPLANKSNIAVFGSYSGSKFLRKEIADKNVFNYRISYKQESQFIISKLLEKGITPKDMVLFSQNDVYGNSGYFAAINELKKRGFKNLNKIYHGRYNSHSLNVETALAKILDYPTQPKVILMFATTTPIIKFMKLAKKDFPNSTFISISPISRNKAIKELGQMSHNLITTQTVPLLNSNLPVVTEFLNEFKKHFPSEEANLTSLEGYIVGKLFVSSLEQSDKKVTDKQSIIDILNNTKDLDIGLGFKSGFDKKHNQYSSKIWSSIINNGIIEEYNWNTQEMK